jgi:hypothetical protein
VHPAQKLIQKLVPIPAKEQVGMNAIQEAYNVE